MRHLAFGAAFFRACLGRFAAAETPACCCRSAVFFSLIGKPAGLPGLPEAHAGPAFGTLAGLVLYVKDEPLDLRSLSAVAQDTHRYAAPGLVKRFMHAFRTNF